MDALFKLEISDLSSAGDGLARLDNGLVVLIPKSLPGDIVLAEIEQTKNNWAQGVLKEVVKPSELRQKSDCLLSEICGGCNLIEALPHKIWPYKAQAHLGKLAENYQVELILKQSAQNINYRCRVKYHLGWGADEQSLKLGFHPRSSHDIVIPTDCKLLFNEFNLLIEPFNDWLRNNNFVNEGSISLISSVEKEKIVFALLDFKEKTSLEQFRILEEKLSVELKTPLYFFFKQENKSPQAINPQAPKYLTVAKWPKLNLILKASPGDFTQVNPYVNEILVNDVIASAKNLKVTKALDIYAGWGNFSLPLASLFWQVTAVEFDFEAVKTGKYNARLNNLKNIKFIRNDAFKAISKLVKSGYKCDFLILDPPRSGAKELVVLLGRLAPKVISYVSCHPATLKRDLAVLISLGYRLDSLTAYDMFPRTNHVESLAVLKLNS